MILYQNSLIILDYTPSSDILSVVWPNAEPYNLAEIRRTLDILVESIRNYDVKKLLIDASQTTVSSELNEAEYKSIVIQFAHDLTKTRLQKSARITTSDKIREIKSRELSATIITDTKLAVDSQIFSTKDEAITWLLAS